MKSSSLPGKKAISNRLSFSFQTITNRPLYITIRLSNGQTQEFRILSYKTRQAYTDDTFRFNPKHYPDAEVIDMR